MSQATTWSVPLVGPASPTVMAQRIDDSLDALLSGNSGSSRPAYAVAGTIWEDTSVANETRLWFYDGTADILVAVVDTTNDRVDLAPQPLVDVASAATTDIGAVKSRNIRITGTTTITSLGTVRAGTTRTLYFAAALTLTYNATSLITPTGADIAITAGSSVDVVSLGSGNWRVQRHVASASGPIKIGTVNMTSGTAVDFTGIPAGVKRLILVMRGITTSGSWAGIVRLGTSGGILNSGYVGSSVGVSTTPSYATVSETTGLGLHPGGTAAYSLDASVAQFVRGDSNEWHMVHDGSYSTGSSVSGRSYKDLGAELTQLRITSLAGTVTFSTGKATLYAEY